MTDGVTSLKNYDPKTFHEDHIFDTPGLVGWLGKRRKKAILAFLSNSSKHPAEVRVLDVGCGYGEILSEFDAVLKVGVDINLTALKEAKQRNKKAFFVLCDIEHLPFKAETFDRVICSEVLEHVDNPKELARGIVDVTRTRGFFCITVPNELITTAGRFLLRKRPFKSPAHKAVFSWNKLKSFFPCKLVKKAHTPFCFMPFFASTNLVGLFEKERSAV